MIYLLDFAIQINDLNPFAIRVFSAFLCVHTRYDSVSQE